MGGYRFRRSQRGAILAFAGMAIVTLVAMAVVGVDLGRLALTATEVQTVAEAGATAYAKAVQQDSGNPTADALAVVAGNRIDGAAATPTNITSFEVGNYSSQTLTFVPGGTPENAVRAHATATVDNFFAGMLGDFQSTVRKDATAAIGCPTRGRVVLPLVVGECEFAAFQSSNDCADLPKLVQQPRDNSCWSTLLASPGGGADTTNSYFPTSCCQNGGGKCGSAATPPEVSIGDMVHDTNGQETATMHILDDCVENDKITDYVVAIVKCDQNLTDCTGESEVVGFASVRVSNVVDTKDTKTVNLDFFCNDTNDLVGETLGFSDECFGTSRVAMVE
jgi:Flp pilus assembly protein TadG